MNFTRIILNPRIQIISLIFIAAVPRLFFMDLIEFKYDEALSLFQTYLFYQQPFLPQIGIQASTGMYNFPLFNYLLIVIGLFSQHPQYISLMVALINTGMIIVFYLLNKKLFGTGVAFLSAISLAASPWAIIFSRKIWAQDFILVFAIPIYYLLLKSLEKRKAQHLAILTFLLLLLIQLHASGIFLMLSVVILFILYKVQINKLKIIKGIFLAALFILPYVIFEFSSTPFCQDCAAFIEYQKSARPFDIENVFRPLQILNGSYFQFILGDSYNEFINYSPLIAPITFLFAVEFLVIFAGIFYFVINRKKDYLFLPLIILIIPLLYFITRTPSYIHYYVIILPVIVTFYALSFRALYQLNKSNIYKTGIITLFSIFFFSKCFFTLQFFQFISQKQNISGDYGPVFKYTANIVNQNLQQYALLPQYEEIKQYGYIFINTPVFHQKLADYFISRQYSKYAIDEYQKALTDNQNDLYSLTNLTYLHIQTGNTEESKKGIEFISTKDAVLSEKLQKILDEKTNISQ